MSDGLNASERWRVVTDEETVFKSQSGQVEVVFTGPNILITWLHARDDPGEEVEMVRFDADAKVLRIFPKMGSGSGFADQFSRITEIQIDTNFWPWSPEPLVGESERGFVELVGLPDGFMRVFDYGLGFPRDYRGLVRAIEDGTECTVVRFGDATEGVKGDTFLISLSRFHDYVKAVNLHKGRADAVVRRIKDNISQNQIADITGADKEELYLGRIDGIKAMTRAISDKTPLDASERTALVGEVGLESRRIAEEQPEVLFKLREDLDLVTLEVLISKFEENLTKAGVAANEAAWQNFLENNTFALQQIFSAPLAYYGEQLEMRSSNMKGAGRRIADFVLVNAVTRSMVIVEIKKPATALMRKTMYRGKEGAEVYSPDPELAGAVAQLQAQMESARTDFPAIVRVTEGAEPTDTRVVRGAVIAGRLESLEDLQKHSFMRYRDALHGIEIITFDEVLSRLRALEGMLKSTHDSLSAPTDSVD
jgi:hypothetical protein